ncbi:MAG: response regulator [Flavisolibacter sp.]
MRNKKHILIIDDDADDREIVRDAFAKTSEDPEYIFLENGDTVLEYLDQNRNNGLPSLILMDLNMPGKDGRDILKEIKSSREFTHIPVIVFTTSSSIRDRSMVYELGANCFLTKPDTFDRMVEIARSISTLWLQ